MVPHEFQRSELQIRPLVAPNGREHTHPHITCPSFAPYPAGSIDIIVVAVILKSGQGENAVHMGHPFVQTVNGHVASQLGIFLSSCSRSNLKKLIPPDGNAVAITFH